MLQEVPIIPAEVKDSEEVFQIFQSARSQMNYLPPIHTVEETRNFIYKLVETGRVLVAKMNNQTAGFMYVKDTFIDHLYVLPDFQNKGIGKLLLNWAKKQNPEGLYLWVFEENEGAINFYEREGFTLVEKRNMSETTNEEGLPDRKYFWKQSNKQRNNQ